MALALRGSRPIVVGDTAYRWTVRRRPAHHPGNGWTLLTFVMEQDTGQGALLVVTLPGPPVLPSTVTESITRALVAGWRPGSRGPVLRCRSRMQRWRHELRGGRTVHPVRRAGRRRGD
jgi:hypothetical protein